jgi:homoserine dehydrogenase
VQDRPGVLARVAAAMARSRVSIATVIQHAADRADAASLVLTTHESDEQSMQATLQRIGRLGSVLERPLLLRIGDFGDNS